ncbi:MAG TPA: hypothetical protein ENK06_00470 [Gammaproteobacteria bacterium]|nr:hypothetical protein [Gammaproteobacteria bacterium]
MSNPKRDSLPQTKAGFTVASSPLNPVKLELGIILVIAFFILIIVSYTVESILHQLALLLSYGAVSMLWLMFRVRKIMMKLN